MSTRFTITVPVTYTKGDHEETSFRRVGVAFLNQRDNGDDMLNIKLDFPVAVDELVGFLPSDKDSVTE